jgi:signal transduction histidine kinase/CheY-like chemotaxis protein
MNEIANEILRDVLESSGVATLVADAELRLRWSNAAAGTVLGIDMPPDSRSELLGSPLADLVEARRDRFAEPEGFADVVLASYADGVHLDGVECRLLTGDGERWLEYSSRPLPCGAFSGGRVERFADVTERRQARLLVEAQQRQAQKMEALGHLAGSVAHDFNNLLTAINGYSQLLEQMLTRDSHRTYVQEIRKAGKRAAVMTSDLLRISRRQITHPEIVDVRRTVQGREDMLRKMIGTNARLLLRLTPSLGSAKIDPNDLEQILLNMAVNASEAMPDGGDLIIAGRNLDLDRSLGKIPPGRYVRIDVIDTGTGMEPDVRTHIFEPLFTTKEKGKGTGFGLAMAYAAITRANGFVHVESAPGEGTTFHVFLPRVIEETDTEETDTEETDTEETGSQATGDAETILLVEDNEGVRTLITEVFQQKGYSLLVARDAEHALEILAGEEEAVDLVISDIVMPAMSGPELARRLGPRFPRMRFLFISGYGEQSAREHGLAEHTVVRKPFDPEDLALKARAVLDG